MEISSISYLALSLVAVMQTLLVVTRSCQVQDAQHMKETALSGANAQEIRDANDIADAGSTFGTHPGVLALKTTDAIGTARTVEFSLAAGNSHSKKTAS